MSAHTGVEGNTELLRMIQNKNSYPCHNQYPELKTA